MSEVSPRINESLYHDTVPQGVLDSARSLSGTGNGAFIMLDESGR